MSFIGIISESRNEAYINRILNNKLTNKNIININEKNIENIKNVTFETILINGENAKILSKLHILKNMITKAKYLVINADVENNLIVLDNINANVITFGFNSKSTITASSVNDENILICVQRIIEDINREKIEPQELLINIDTISVGVHTVMGIVALLIIYGIKDINII